jgi:hypothetical protein
MRINQLYPARDFAPMESFDLRWRWTSPAHALLPTEVLAAIRPFTSAAAAVLNAEALIRVPSPAAAADDSIACDQTVAEEDVAWWLQHLSGNSAAETVVSWDAARAVLVPWTTFATYWSDFCYPSSDDVFAWQPDCEWTVAYQHHELFRYFRHRAAHAV